MRRFIAGLFLFLFSLLAYAEIGEQPLPADQAFSFSPYLNEAKQVVLEWHIAPNYYLYRDKMHITSPKTGMIHLVLPPGHPKKDSVNGDYQAYTGTVSIPVAITLRKPGMVNMTVHYQGCSAAGFCYPPMTKELRVDFASLEAANSVVITNMLEPLPSPHTVDALFLENNKFFIILSLLGLGLLLAFTPCVLPMVPILSGIIVGQGRKLTSARAFFLSLTYVLGMALMYALAGMIVATLGSSIQPFFQKPVVVITFGLCFVLLALSLFDVYHLQIPSVLQKHLTHWSHKQKGGTYVGVFIMGALSSLIVSPCVTAPLVGVLTYIAQTGDKVLGGLALLALGLGMGIPLLLIGVSAGKLLPRSGPWMNVIKKIMGVILLAFAVWLVARVIPGVWALFLWGILVLSVAILMSSLVTKQSRLRKMVDGFRILVAVYGITLIAAGFTGQTDPFALWKHQTKIPSQTSQFYVISTMAQLDEELRAAQKANRPVLIDFYADWCVACVNMDKHVFHQKDVEDALRDWILLRLDLTQNTALDQALLKRFNVIAPPTFLFFSPNGEELPTQRIVGEINANEFLQHLQNNKGSL